MYMAVSKSAFITKNMTKNYYIDGAVNTDHGCFKCKL